MAGERSSKAVREYLAEIGRKGGKKKVPKGTAKLPKERRQEIARKAAATRWSNAKKKQKKQTRD
jgi:general stress protein YciG